MSDKEKDLEQGQETAETAEKGQKKADSVKESKKVKKAKVKKEAAEDDLFTGGSISGKEKKKKPKAALKKKQKTPEQLAKSKARRAKIFSKRNVKIFKSVTAAVIVIAILFAYVATGTVRKGFVHSTLQWTTYLTGVTIESEDGEKMKVPVSTYNYYFAMTYNNLQSTQSTYESYGLDLETYGLDVDFDTALSKQTTTNDDGDEVTWAEYLKEEVIESIQYTYSYYMEAVKENGGEEPEITEDQQTELDETLDEYKETANSYGYTLSGYLVQAMGAGVTENVFRREATRSYIAENYEEEYSESTEDTEYTDEDIEAYKDENEDEFLRVSVKIFEADTEDDAKAFLDALQDDGSNFAELCGEYSSDDFYKTYYTEEEGSYTYLYMTKSNFESLGFAIAAADEDDEDSYPGLDWLFSEDRQAGDAKQYSTTVVYVISPAEFSEMKAVNVRHILITPETDDDADAVDATDEQWAAAYESAESILEEFNSSDKTSDSFAELAEEYSEDTESTSSGSSGLSGGLYEDITPGEMIDTFNYWCFSGHEAGDTGIVKTSYGYHIMYFDSESDTEVWKIEAQSALESTAETAVEDSYTATVSWFGSRYFEIDTDIDY
ncbi:MAG: peptidylprolyl isomerase [Clostridiales bacterium]|nr:peptidylprolyl isomerase [Clostridiales bacterium]